MSIKNDLEILQTHLKEFDAGRNDMIKQLEDLIHDYLSARASGDKNKAFITMKGIIKAPTVINQFLVGEIAGIHKCIGELQIEIFAQEYISNEERSQNRKINGTAYGEGETTHYDCG